MFMLSNVTYCNVTFIQDEENKIMKQPLENKKLEVTGFVRVMEKLESHGILEFHFPGLESHGI